MSDATEETANPAADGTAVDQAAAEAARAELDARAEKLRANGWVEPPDQPFPFLTMDVATDEQRASHREELRCRHEAAKARAMEVLGRVRQRERDGLVFKIHDNARPGVPDIPKSSESEAKMTEVKTTEKLSPLEALAEELGIAAARFEKRS